MRSLQLFHALTIFALLMCGILTIPAAFAGDNTASGEKKACCADKEAAGAEAGKSCCTSGEKAEGDQACADGEKACCKNKGDKSVKVAGMDLAPCEDEGEPVVHVRPAGWPVVGVQTELGFFPVNTCPVTGETLDPNSHKLHSFDFDGRLVTVCCPGCESRFRADSARFVANLDEMIRTQQAPHYPLTACPTTGGELGGMGEPALMIEGNYLVKLCCAGCSKGVKADPTETLAKLEAAYSALLTEDQEFAPLPTPTKAEAVEVASAQ